MVYVTSAPRSKYKAFIYYSGNVTYAIFTYTFAPHLNSSKCIVNPNFHAVYMYVPVCRYISSMHICVWGGLNSVCAFVCMCVCVHRLRFVWCMWIEQCFCGRLHSAHVCV